MISQVCTSKTACADMRNPITRLGAFLGEGDQNIHWIHSSFSPALSLRWSFKKRETGLDLGEIANGREGTSSYRYTVLRIKVSLTLLTGVCHLNLSSAQCCISVNNMDIAKTL